MTAKSDRVKRLLEDEDLLEAFENCRKAIHQGWERTPPSDTELQAEWHRRLFTLQSVEVNLRRAIQDGKLEDFKAAEQEKPTPLGDILKWRMNRK